MRGQSSLRHTLQKTNSTKLTKNIQETDKRKKSGSLNDRVHSSNSDRWLSKWFCTTLAGWWNIASSHFSSPRSADCDIFSLLSYSIDSYKYSFFTRRFTVTTYQTFLNRYYLHSFRTALYRSTARYWIQVFVSLDVSSRSRQEIRHWQLVAILCAMITPIQSVARFLCNSWASCLRLTKQFDTAIAIVNLLARPT